MGAPQRLTAGHDPPDIQQRFSVERNLGCDPDQRCSHWKKSHVNASALFRNEKSSLRDSAHSRTLDPKQRREFLELAADIAHTDGAVMRGTMRIPLSDEVPCADREPITAVGISDFENWAGYRLPLGHQQLNAPVACLNNGQQRNWSAFYRHFD